jgi:hypothetical protein
MNRFVLYAAVGLLGLLSSVPDASAQGRRNGGLFGRWAEARASRGGRTLYRDAGVSYVAPAAEPVAYVEEQAASAWQTCRYLRIKNATDQKITVYLQYRTPTNKNLYRWYPEDPRTATKALAFELAPGVETALYHDNWQINACRCRLWAVAADGSEWLDYKAKDLWLIEDDGNGIRGYQADDIETYTFTFAP